MIMEEPTADFALLTPVPHEHLQSGLAVCAVHGRVTYGTDSGMVLSEFAHAVGADSTVDILFYASEAPISGVPKATFRGRFVEYVGAKNGKAPGMAATYRPLTTANDGAWQSFYIVSDLRELTEPIELTTLTKRNSKSKLKANFIPIGPLVIETPF